jgi:hypothetical protein
MENQPSTSQHEPLVNPPESQLTGSAAIERETLVINIDRPEAEFEDHSYSKPAEGLPACMSDPKYSGELLLAPNSRYYFYFPILILITEQ